MIKMFWIRPENIDEEPMGRPGWGASGMVVGNEDNTFIRYGVH